MKYLPLLLVFGLIVSCQKPNEPKQEENRITTPKNIVLLIGDGTGLSQVSASQFYNPNPSNFDRFPVIGLIKTSATDNLITDSAAGATAFASGIKSYNGAIGVNSDTLAVATIAEELADQGFSTGVIATSSITHATPASFYAHVKSRRLYEDIAAFLPESKMEFFAGGGLQFFNQRKDSVDLLEKLEANGFKVDTTALPTTVTQEKRAILLAANAMPKIMEDRGDFLPKATELALQSLSQNDQGFFLMVEGSQIDWGGHDNDADYLISELIDFDTTIGVALDFAAKNKETLVIVTADHETGGFTLSAKGSNYNEIEPSFSTGGHSATMIPVFAIGPGSEAFAGVYENSEIYHKMKAALRSAQSEKASGE